MNPGQEYEDFVYERACKLFANGIVTKRAYKHGQRSGLQRELDVLVEAPPQIAQGVFIVLSCKDYKKRPADITTLGEFAAVIDDVGAAAGWLLCTSGFAKSNHEYAKSLGIQLVTIEDLSSDKWTSNAKLPVVVTKYTIGFHFTASIEVTPKLVKLNQKPLTIPTISNDTRVRVSGRAPTTLLEWAQWQVAKAGFAVREGGTMVVPKPRCEVELLHRVWAPAQIEQLSFQTSSRRYVKKFAFDEYIELHDHVYESHFPIQSKANFTLAVDDSWDKVAADAYDNFAGLIIEMEDWPA